MLVYKKGEERTVERLLPNFCPPDGPLCMPARKSPVQYLWQPGTLLALSLGLCGVASYTMPQILPMLFVPVVLALAGLLVSLEGFFREGLHKTPTARCPYVIPVFTRHEVCVFTPDLSYTLLENPFSVSGGRCDVRVHLPCGLRYRVRGALQYLAREIPFTLWAASPCFSAAVQEPHRVYSHS